MVDSSILSQDELTKILNEHKESLKAIAAQNVERQRYVDTFVRGLTMVRHELSNHNNDDEQDPTSLPDYNKKIKDAMTAHKNSQQYLQIHQETLYRQLAEAIGEKLGTDEDEDEIQVTETQNATSLKCPVTGKLYEEPCKNKLCNHVYSRAGIMEYIRSKGGSCPCPVGGCGNRGVTVDQLEKDVEMEMLVRRQVRRDDRDAQQRASQAADLMDSDEE